MTFTSRIVISALLAALAVTAAFAQEELTPEQKLRTEQRRREAEQQREAGNDGQDDQIRDQDAAPVPFGGRGAHDRHLVGDGVGKCARH